MSNKIEIVDIDIPKSLASFVKYIGVDKPMDPPKEPNEQEKAMLRQGHESYKHAVMRGLIKECYPGELDHIWEELNQEESRMLNKATGKPMKNGELWARNENYRERMIARLQELEDNETVVPLKMFYKYIREELFIPCRKERLDATVSHDLNKFRNNFSVASKMGFEILSGITEELYNEEVLDRTENLTEYV